MKGLNRNINSGMFRQARKNAADFFRVTQRFAVLVLLIAGLHFLLPVIMHSGMIEFQVVTTHKVDYLRPGFRYGIRGRLPVFLHNAPQSQFKCIPHKGTDSVYHIAIKLSCCD